MPRNWEWAFISKRIIIRGINQMKLLILIKMLVS